MECLVSGSRDIGIDTWDSNTGANLQSFQHAAVSIGHASTIITTTSTGKTQLITPDTKKPYLHSLIFSLPRSSSSSTGGAAFDTLTSHALPSHVSALGLSPSHLYIIAASSTQQVCYCYSAVTNALIQTWQAHYKPITVIRFTDDERFVITGAADGMVNVWQTSDIVRDREAEERLTQYVQIPQSLQPETGNTNMIIPYQVFSSHTLPITDLHVTASNAPIFSGSLDHTVHVHSIVHKQTTQHLVLPAALTTVTVTTMHTVVLAGSVDGNIYYYPIHKDTAGKLTQSSNGHTADSTSTAIVPPPASTSIAMLGHTGPITCLALNLDNSLLASTAHDHVIRVWDMETQQCIKVISRTTRLGYDWVGWIAEGWDVGCNQGAYWHIISSKKQDGGIVPLTLLPSNENGDEEEAEQAEQEEREFLEEWDMVRSLAHQDQSEATMSEELSASHARLSELEKELASWKQVNRQLYSLFVNEMLKQNGQESGTQLHDEAEVAQQNAPQSSEE